MTRNIQIQIQDNAIMPERATSGSSGYDLCSNESLSIQPGAFAKVRTGISLSMPEGIEAQIRPRSGLAAKHGITVLNAPGTIDSDYRGEICILLINHGAQPFAITSGMRIAQMVFAHITDVSLKKVEHLAESKRGTGGFGSTGTKVLEKKL